MSHVLRTAPVLAGIAAAFLLAPGAATAQSSGDIAASPVRLSDGLIPETGLSGPIGRAASRMPLVNTPVLERTANTASGAVLPGAPGASASVGSGEMGGLGREAFGISTAPYTTARVAVSNLGPSNNKVRTPVTSFPYRATGKIYARWGSNWFVCTASLVKKGVLVTAAHCIHEFGKRAAGWADEVIWIPAEINQNRNRGPYGVWKSRRMYIPNSYFTGNDTCTQTGVVCNNDIATIVLQRRGGKFAGNVLGWYDYGWNGFSYRSTSFLGNTTTVQITQLGYPVAFDRGYQMQRTDAVGWFVQDGALRNTQLGSAQTGGSSGGPWLANFGTRPNVSSSASLGSESASNVVIGVTSYGAVQVGFNRQGASFFGQNTEFPRARYGSFGAGNIGRLMQVTCNNNKAFC